MTATDRATGPFPRGGCGRDVPGGFPSAVLGFGRGVSGGSPAAVADPDRDAPVPFRYVPGPLAGAVPDPHRSAPVPLPVSAHHPTFRAIRELRSPR
ncbi:hypothetical protein ACSLFT_32080 [Streptomyces sp. G6]|uniref:hypothetical protein n=1 Tax=Streptomyces sp. G6 TaxID=1178736 RepID=UPI003ED9E7A3